MDRRPTWTALEPRWNFSSDLDLCDLPPRRTKAGWLRDRAAALFASHPAREPTADRERILGDQDRRRAGGLVRVIVSTSPYGLWRRGLDGNGGSPLASLGRSRAP